MEVEGPLYRVGAHHFAESSYVVPDVHSSAHHAGELVQFPVGVCYSLQRERGQLQPGLSHQHSSSERGDHAG